MTLTHENKCMFEGLLFQSSELFIRDCHPLTRRERAMRVRGRDHFHKYGDEARAVLDALLDKYADQGIADIEDVQVLKIDPLSRLGTPHEIIERFGTREQYIAAVRELEQQLYAV